LFKATRGELLAFNKGYVGSYGSIKKIQVKLEKRVGLALHLSFG
jgi:hypothetical protein